MRTQQRLATGLPSSWHLDLPSLAFAPRRCAGFAPPRAEARDLRHTSASGIPADHAVLRPPASSGGPVGQVDPALGVEADDARGNTAEHRLDEAAADGRAAGWPRSVALLALELLVMRLKAGQGADLIGRSSAPHPGREVAEATCLGGGDQTVARSARQTGRRTSEADPDRGQQQQAAPDEHEHQREGDLDAVERRPPSCVVELTAPLGRSRCCPAPALARRPTGRRRGSRRSKLVQQPTSARTRLSVVGAGSPLRRPAPGRTPIGESRRLEVEQIRTEVGRRGPTDCPMPSRMTNRFGGANVSAAWDRPDWSKRCGL